MKEIKRQSKEGRNSKDSYFGNYGEVSAGISLAEFSEPSESNDVLHYHKKSEEYYITLQGSGTIEVEGKEYTMSPDNMIVVEPGEKHRVKEATETPFSFIVFATVKDKDDKVIVE